MKRGVEIRGDYFGGNFEIFSCFTYICFYRLSPDNLYSQMIEQPVLCLDAQLLFCGCWYYAQKCVAREQNYFQKR